MLQRLALVALAAFTSAACFVNVSRVKDPDRYFADAMRSARAVAGKEGPARELRVLVYEADSEKLIRVEIPLGIVKRLAEGHDFDWDFDHHSVCHSDSRGCREMRRKLRKFRSEDLDKLPLGPLVEVTEDDGERVFVYLR